MDIKNFEGKKILIFGLGILGGGVSTVKWFSQIKGVKLRITDLKDKEGLKESLKKLKGINAKYILGRHRKEDIDWADVIVVNPGVSINNKFIKYAFKKNKVVVNDLFIFFNLAKSDIIAITGTRGKTTTSNWIFHFLKNLKGRKVYLGGNQPENPLLKILPKTKPGDISIIEVSSFQLEFCNKKIDKNFPKLAIITNIYKDHLNRYKSMKEYVRQKVNIFLNQGKDDYLILNKDNKWTDYILKFKPRSKILFLSKNPIKNDGVYLKDNFIYIRFNGKEKKVLSGKNFIEKYGEHNLYNLMNAILAAYIFGLKIDKIRKLINSLPQVRFRQEIVYKDKNFTIINDSSATSPEATIQAIERFKDKNLILITGGTNKNLEFKELAKKIKKYIKKENLILLSGSATRELKKELKKLKYDVKYEFENLNECLEKALENKKGVILFSPASASFEKFKNEFDRGRKFNKLVYNIFRAADLRG
ncbi:MAG: UDP-N-acetylmuramoyl-L-alanine--D-glutamate ligase [Minisyncoccia bacterium]